MTQELQALLEPVITLSQRAGLAILRFYQEDGEMSVAFKADKTPVTAADLAAHQIIKEGLQQLTPDLPIISEEAATLDYEIRRRWQRYWLVDPLDGTKEFLHRTDEFTVNIALIEQHRPILGVIYAPILDTYYYAAEGYGAFRRDAEQQAERLHCRTFDPQQLIIAISRRHGLDAVSEFNAATKAATVIRCGSSLKSCMVAAGQADLYPCLGLTSEWDMGAAQCIVEQAGGAVFDLQLRPLRYNTKASLLNPHLLIVGDRQFDWANFLENRSKQ